MSRFFTPDATLLIDRHYNSLKPYRKGEFNMYAVLKNDTCVASICRTRRIPPDPPAHNNPTRSKSSPSPTPRLPQVI